MSIQAIARGKIILAIDVPSEKEALSMVEKLREHVGLFKVGLELLSSAGPEIVRRIVEAGGEVFLDGKFLDIPNTVAGASRAVTKLGVRMFNTHALGGSRMMQRAVEASAEEAAVMSRERPMVLAVTILTSIDQAAMSRDLRIPGSVGDQVGHLARLAFSAGLDGVIASPQEARELRHDLPDTMAIVTPGVRPSWASSGDQKRITTPGEAVRNGASYLVIGRPITDPPTEIGDSVSAARAISDEIGIALENMEA